MRLKRGLKVYILDGGKLEPIKEVVEDRGLFPIINRYALLI